MSPILRADVVVVGCGPVGAIAGNLLGQSGVKTLVIDEAVSPHSLPRAVHIDHEIMRSLQAVDLADALAPLMREAQGHIHIGADGGVIRYMGTAGKPRRFGWANDYFFYQPEFEAVLREGLSRFDCVELHLGTRLTDLRQDADGVTLTLNDDTATLQVRAAHVIACDGARSATRKALGVRLDDLNFNEPWLVVDAEVDRDIKFPAYEGVPEEADLQTLSVMLCEPRRPATVVPGRGRHRRWEFMLLPGEDEGDMVQAQTVASLLEPWIGSDRHRIIRAATYRFHGLVAEQWRIGRVFLAGDAAHQTPPFFGQGMCHGVRDVSNLAWKLALVLSGKAGPALMDTYQRERDPQVRAVIAASIAAGRYICQLDPDLAAKRDAELRETFGHHQDRPPPDLIPPYRDGVIGPGGGERFVQPLLVDGAGKARLLDDIAGAGFVLITRDWASEWEAHGIARDILHRINVRRITVAWGGRNGDFTDAHGHLMTWLDERGADAVLLRPDAYVYGLARTPSALDTLVRGLGLHLHLAIDGHQHRESDPCAV